MFARVLVVLLLLGAGTAGARAQSLVEPYVEGQQYFTLPVPVASGNKGITVTEFFSYACIHCFHFDPEVEAWRKKLPPDVTFERVPAVFSRQWVLYAQAYYVARACGVLETTHTPFFRAIHIEHKRFASPDDVAEFYADIAGDAGGQCSTKQDFLNVFDSFGVNAAVQQSIAKGRAFQANGVPTMIVDGLWRTDGTAAGTNEQMLDVVDYLIRRARVDAAADAEHEADAPSGDQ